MGSGFIGRISRVLFFRIAANMQEKAGRADGQKQSAAIRFQLEGFGPNFQLLAGRFV
jgi:hypothetical protein